MEKIFKKLESSSVPLWKWMGLGGFSVFLFYLLGKVLSNPQFITFSPNTITFFEGLLFHFVFFLGFFLLNIVIIHLLSGRELLKVAKPFFGFSSLLILIVIIDRLFSLTSIMRFRESFPELLKMLGSAFHPLVWSSFSSGITPGIKITVLLGGAIVGYYIYSSRRDIKRAIAGFLIFLGLPILFNSIPLLFSSLIALSTEKPYHFVFHETGLISSVFRRYGLVFLFVSTAILVLFIYKYNREYWRSLFEDFLSFIGIEFALLSSFGFGIGYFFLKDVYISPFLNPLDYFMLPGIIIGSLLLVIAIENLKRETLNWIPLFLLSLLYFLFINYSTFFIALFIFALGVFFRSSPLRLYRFKPIDTLFLGMIGFFVTVIGFSVFGQARSFLTFPVGIAFITFFIVWGVMELKRRVQKGWIPYFTIILQIFLGVSLLFLLAQGKVFQDKELAWLNLYLLPLIL